MRRKLVAKISQVFADQPYAPPYLNAQTLFVIVLFLNIMWFTIIRAFYLDVDCVTNTQFQDFVRYRIFILLLLSFMLCSLISLSYLYLQIIVGIFCVFFFSSLPASLFPPIASIFPTPPHPILSIFLCHSPHEVQQVMWQRLSDSGTLSLALLLPTDSIYSQSIQLSVRSARGPSCFCRSVTIWEKD